MHFPKKELAYAVAFVALLAGFYVGSYYAMIGPETPKWDFSAKPVPK
jgi:hypothetical protein